MAEWIEELTWKCGDCRTEGILGRFKECPNCGSPREKGEMNMSENEAGVVKDPVLLDLFTGGADWFCTHCSAGNRGDRDRCLACGAPRYGEAKENHPAFPTDHVGKAAGFDGQDQRMDSAPPMDDELAPMENLPPQQPKVKINPAPPPEPPVDDEPIVPQPTFSPKALGIMGAIFLILVAFAVWASRTHKETATIEALRWERTAVIESWTPYKVESWRHATTERAETPPVNGVGERAGMTLLSCRKKHYEDRHYVCGTMQESYECGKNEPYSATCTDTESYNCGKTCKDNGNGSRTCRTKRCSRTVSKSCTKYKYVSKKCERTVPKTCTEPIYRDYCEYQTQKWEQTDRRVATGVKPDLVHYPRVELGPNQRQHRSGAQWMDMRYSDGRTTFTVSEAQYDAHRVGEKITINVNNLGGVTSFDEVGAK